MKFMVMVNFTKCAEQEIGKSQFIHLLLMLQYSQTDICSLCFQAVFKITFKSWNETI